MLEQKPLVRKYTSDFIDDLIREETYALLSTLLALILGYPLAYFIAFHGGRYRTGLVMLLLIPFWTSYLVRTYGWMTLLGSEGLVNQALEWVGLVSEPVALLNTPLEVYAMLKFGITPKLNAISTLTLSLTVLGIALWSWLRS